MQMLFTFFFSKHISIYAIFNDQSFNDTLTEDIVSFEELGPDLWLVAYALCHGLHTLPLGAIIRLLAVIVALPGHHHYDLFYVAKSYIQVTVLPYRDRVTYQ